jgi:hypothetical protein
MQALSQLSYSPTRPRMVQQRDGVARYSLAWGAAERRRRPIDLKTNQGPVSGPLAFPSSSPRTLRPPGPQVPRLPAAPLSLASAFSSLRHPDGIYLVPVTAS